jgi:hypothetical protein
MNLTTRTLRPILAHSVGAAVMVAGALLHGPQLVSAADNGPTQTGEICMQKVFGTPVTNSNRLNCTANDIRLSRAISVSPATCTRGETFDLTATFETVVTANARYDAGFFFRIDGGANARGDGTGATGECSLSALLPPPPPNPPALNLDGDACGDLNAGTFNVTFTIPQVLCQDNDGDGFLNLPNCTSWHSNQGTVCSPITDAFQFDPDTKSKCVCDDNFQVPVRVETATLDVTKSALPTQVPEPSGTVTYTVAIKNTAQIETVTISSIIDDCPAAPTDCNVEYGNLGDVSNPNVSDNTCPSLIGTSLAPQATATCSFKALVSGNAGDRKTDVVTACVTQSGVTQPICDNDSADVDITDVFTAPTLQKSAQSTANCQLDATYQVVVSNNSSVDKLTVNSLNDDTFGNIASVQGPVLSTTCSVPQTIDPLGNYTCSFVGRIVSSSCSINHTNTVTANVIDDDGIPSTPFDDANVSVTATP